METLKNQNTLLLFSSPWQRLPFFHGLPAPLVHQLLQGARFQNVKSREIIFQQDRPADTFGFVVEGLVRLFRKNPKGQRVLMDIVGPGGMVGGLLMTTPNSVFPVTAQATGPGQFLRIPRLTYTEFWLQHPEVIQRTQTANLERMQAIQSTRELQKYSLEEKLIQVLLRLSACQNGHVLVSISRTDLSDMIGASVESVIRVFSKWEKEGFVQWSSDGKEMISKERLLERVTV
jgi:CRP-like cAMP-binding protein